MTQRAFTQAGNIGPLQAFQQAAALHAQGRLRDAERLYEIVLEADDRHFESIYRLGLIRLQQGRFAEAAGLFRRAIKIEKNSADAHFHLAVALTGLGRIEEALARYEKALALKPHFAEAHNNFGYALQMLGRHQEAAAHYEKALAINPAYAEARNNLGNALQILGRSEAAIAQYQRAIAIRPNYAEAHNNLGNALGTLGRHGEAIVHYEMALTIRPPYAEAHHSLGNALGALGRHAEAIRHFEDALTIRPDLTDTRISLGRSLVSLGRDDEAIPQFDEALAIRPRDVEALTRRGSALSYLGRFDEALTSFEKAFSIEPDHPQAFNGLARSALHGCDWARTAKLSQELAHRISAKNLVMSPFHVLGSCSDPALHLACARNYVRDQVPVLPPPLCTDAIWRNEKIRLAYLATGFRRHPNAYLTAELFELHDRSRFEIIGISLGYDDRSDMRTRLVKAFDQFHDVRLTSDREVAVLLHDLRVDIAVDRSGYVNNARPGILAHRPAPIQVNYLGFPGTLGAEFYDYVIADPIVLPFDQQQFYTEQIVHLPECYQSNDSKRAIAETLTRQEMGLPDAGFVFCCFNNNYKITPPVFDIWMRLLQQVEGSVLWLYRSSAVAEANLRREAAARGIAPERLIFADGLALEEHLARHRLADLFLDTLPYGAHTTASDALWAGLPVITCRGESFAGRVAASLLTAVGLPELATGALAEYENLALRLAREPGFLSEFRRRLQQNRLVYPLFDTDRYRRHIEAAYIKMWQIWQSGERPRSFAIEPYGRGTPN